MANKTITYDDEDALYSGVIVAKHIVRLSKTSDGRLTRIHLDNGDVVLSKDPMKVLQARIDLLKESEA
jgi:hypothetical protein